MPNVPRLFHSLVVGRARLRNRIVMEALPSGLATSVGLANTELVAYYAERARGGLGMLVIEPMRVTPPRVASRHLGIYSDVHTPALHDFIGSIKREDCAVLTMLDQPADAPDDMDVLNELTGAFVLAARRARIADADGIMLSTTDDGPFHGLADHRYGEQRLTRLLSVVETIVERIGRRFVIGVRLGVEEHMPGGLSLQDARVVARRLTSAGVNLIEVAVRVGPDTPVAQFPGWCVPVAAAIRSFVDVPVMVGGLLDDPFVAESAVAEGGADLIAVADRLREEPRWPDEAWTALNDE